MAPHSCTRHLCHQLFGYAELCLGSIVGVEAITKVILYYVHERVWVHIPWAVQAHPEALANRLQASARVNEMIASAIHVDPKWFWRNVRSLMQARGLLLRSGNNQD